MPQTESSTYIVLQPCLWLVTNLHTSNSAHIAPCHGNLLTDSNRVSQQASQPQGTTPYVFYNSPLLATIRLHVVQWGPSFDIKPSLFFSISIQSDIHSQQKMPRTFCPPLHSSALHLNAPPQLLLPDLKHDLYPNEERHRCRSQEN